MSEAILALLQTHMQLCVKVMHLFILAQSAARDSYHLNVYVDDCFEAECFL